MLAFINTDPDYDVTVIPFFQKVDGNSYSALHPPGSYYESNTYPVAVVKAAGAILAAGSDAPVETRASSIRQHDPGMGWGIEADYEQAAMFFERAAELGDAWGQYNIGHAYLDGRGVERDAARAHAYYLRSAEQGHARAI